MNYKIEGGIMPILEVSLNDGETIITQSGGMVWMSPNMKMETTAGGAGKVLKKVISGESIFQNRYTAMNGPGFITIAPQFMGTIIPFEISPNQPIIVQKSGFLASTTGVNLEICFSKKVGAGLVGGEGFIMQRLSGQGTAFVEVDGAVVNYNLAPGQQMIIDTGYLVAMDPSVQMAIQQVPGLKNKFLGGEGLFNTVVTGPGRIWLQTMPINTVAGLIASYIPGR